jgi:DNA-binding response OmpR family regulator
LNIPSKRAKAMKLGADAYFCKPFEPEELFVAIEKLLSL